MIKPLEYKDKEYVIYLIQQPKEDIRCDGFLVEPSYYSRFEEIIKNGWCYKYEENGKLKGFIIAGNDGIRTNIYDLEVVPKYQNKGIATKLLKKIILKSKKQGYTTSLYTDTYNYKSISLYIKHKCDRLIPVNWIIWEG